eukprot:CAMPEP_0114291014 /NCGR_PEP_ID=MMETSP0059-20121206/8256_1 /TAXON_ID=36894 /ORGANISM="Pyramimonas parkeae, Strain CCMP726" /LENGTH=159 /DNA_ID=CAMNT_0001412475 /DNA_START=96 /DNA_END=572 /DNA_ORIENTATION=+
MPAVQSGTSTASLTLLNGLRYFPNAIHSQLGRQRIVTIVCIANASALSAKELVRLRIIPSDWLSSHRSCIAFSRPALLWRGISGSPMVDNTCAVPNRSRAMTTTSGVSVATKYMMRPRSPRPRFWRIVFPTYSAHSNINGGMLIDMRTSCREYSRSAFA